MGIFLAMDGYFLEHAPPEHGAMSYKTLSRLIMGIRPFMPVVSVVSEALKPSKITSACSDLADSLAHTTARAIIC